MLVTTIAPLLGLLSSKGEREAFSLNMDIFFLYASQPYNKCLQTFLVRTSSLMKSLFKSMKPLPLSNRKISMFTFYPAAKQSISLPTGLYSFNLLFTNWILFLEYLRAYMAEFFFVELV